MSREEIKSSMSPEERARRRVAVGKSASEKVAKSEQLNFRIEEQSITEIQEVAFRKGMPVGTMIRDWVLERLSQEKLGTSDITGRAIHLLDDIRVKLNSLFATFESEAQAKYQQAGSAASFQGAHQPSSPRELCAPLPLACAESAGYLLAMQAVPGGDSLPVVAYPPSAAPCSPASALPAGTQSKLDEQVSKLDHLRAWEHLLADQLVVIRHQREEAERSYGK